MSGCPGISIALVSGLSGYLQLSRLHAIHLLSTGFKAVCGCPHARIYKAEGLQVRTKKRNKRASTPRVSLARAQKPGQRWSMDFTADKLADGRRFRVLTVVDHYDRSCPVLYADQSIGAGKVIEAQPWAEKVSLAVEALLPWTIPTSLSAAGERTSAGCHFPSGNERSTPLFGARRRLEGNV